MRILNKLCLLFLLLGMVGCSVQDDPSVCPVNGRMTLYFTLEDQGTDLFSQMITSVNAYIFDSTKTLIEERRLDSYNLSFPVTVTAGQKPGFTVEYEPGDYYAVCWGNVGERSGFRSGLVKGVTRFEDCAIQIPPTSTATGDPIYYAPYKLNPYQNKSVEIETRAIDPTMTLYAFTIAKGEVREKKMNFVNAHRTVNIYIYGYTDGTPVVQATHLCTEYNFLYQSAGQYRDFMRPAEQVDTPEGKALLVTFYFGFDEITDDIIFTLKRSASGSTIPGVDPINLLEFILDQGLSDKEPTYDIRIIFSTLGVTIDIPEWGNIPVKPEK